MELLILGWLTFFIWEVTDLNSNMELLIFKSDEDFSREVAIFKFQYGATNIKCNNGNNILLG